MRAQAAIALLAAAQLAGAGQAVSQSAPAVRLSGTVTAADHQQYLEQPFEVPPDVEAFSVAFRYPRDAGVVIDLGLLEGGRLRGWSGGNKSAFTVGDWASTPSFFPGPVAGRRFALLLGVPNARAGASVAWQADISFRRRGDPLDGPVLRAGPGWYRGDLHAHTAHSDGSCDNGKGQRRPCPVHRTVEAAAAAKLDFIALTDHNTVTQHHDIEQLQPLHPTLLLLPGQEVTTFQGHANLIGTHAPMDFRIGPDGRAWSRSLAAGGGLVSINHPGLPSGEACMGCGWTLRETDWTSVDAVEIANGGALAASGGRLDGPLSAIPFWEQRLAEGRLLAPVGGSDNHDPTLPPADPRAIGRVVTVVWADALSTAGIVAGIKRGRVFVDLAPDPAHRLDVSASAGVASARMGEMLPIKGDEELGLKADVAGCRGCTIRFILDGRVLPVVQVPDDPAVVEVTLRALGARWVRAEALDGEGRRVMISAAILLRPGGQ
jgi:hypothetical protein